MTGALLFIIIAHFLLFNPMSAVDMLPVEEQAFDYWSFEEASHFLSYANEKYNGTKRCIYVFYLLSLKSGLRLGEMVALKWNNVIFEQKLLRINSTFERATNSIKNTTKGKKIRYVGIDRDLLLELKELKLKSNSEFVFTNEIDNFVDPDNFRHRYFMKDLRESNSRVIKIHDMRHTFASHYMMNGGNIYDLQMLLGHSDIKTTMRYAHLSPQHIADKANIVNFNTDLFCEKSKIIHLVR